MSATPSALTSKIYIDMDSLFDTRMATLAALDAEAATKLLQSDEYWARETNQWYRLTRGKVSDEAFNTAYAKRDNQTLQRSVITGIIAPLLKVLTLNEQARLAGVHNKEITLEINLHPYTLTFEELELLPKLIIHRLGIAPRITFCSVPVEELTAGYLVANYAGAFMYDFNGWIKLHLADLIKSRNPDFTLVVPKLFEKDVSKLSVDDKKDQITSFRMYMLEYIDITVIDLACYSTFRV